MFGKRIPIIFNIIDYKYIMYDAQSVIREDVCIVKKIIFFVILLSVVIYDL